jgi:4-diphosphocytidyl-2-C-methyl-D-erythritol kinase
VSGAAAAVAAQAKINLFLHVLAQEESGYHQIETLMCRLDLADDVVVRVTSRGRALECIGADTGPSDGNLALRAASTYAAARGWPAGFAIELTKRIPVGGGLGGGSADAGAVLRALRALDPSPPSVAVVVEWAAQIGADVPALTLEAPLVLGWGRGERLLPLPALPPRPVVLCVPDARVATGDAYAWLAAARRTVGPGRSVSAPPGHLLDLAALQQWETIAPLMRNDFDAVVGPRYPDIVAAAERLRAIPGAYGALMSGSGSTVYAVLRSATAPPLPIVASWAGETLVTQTAAHVVGVRRID